MSANIKLRVGGKEFSNFSAVSVDADVYQSASVFELQLAGKIITDDLRNKSCKLYINGKCELYGVVDSKELSWSKTDLATVMTGRSLMGLLVDAHSPIYGDVEADSLKALTEQLISKLPYIQQLLISYAGLSSTQAGKIKEWIEPGKTIFAVLSELAKRSGVVFYGMPDGGFYFDNLQYLKKPVFSITRRKDGTGNAIAGKRREDVSKLFSTITVLSTMQGNNAVHTSGLQSSYTLSVPDFPAADNGISFNKPFYTLDTSGLMTPQKAAQLIYDMCGMLKIWSGMTVIAAAEIFIAESG